MKPLRILELDGLRGIAAALVMIGHYTNAYYGFFKHPDYRISSLPFADIGFQLFFIISGFFISMSLATSEKRERFITNRFSRLFPVYWICVFLTSFFVSMFDYDNGVTYKQIVVNMTMMQSYLGVAHIDGVYWTLQLELLFYCSLFLIYTRLGKSNTVKIFSGIMIISIFDHVISHEFYQGISFIIRIIENYFPAALIRPSTAITSLLALFFKDYIHLFFIGICLYNIRSQTPSSIMFIKGISLIIFSTIYNYILRGETQTIIVLLSIILVALSIWGKAPIFRTPFFRFLGRISYPLYLIHQRIGYGILEFSFQKNYNMHLATMTLMLIMIVIAFLLSKYIEFPAMLFFRKYFNSTKMKLKKSL